MTNLIAGICFWREAPEPAVGPDRRAGEEGLIPKVEVTFGWPRINGRPAAVTGASAHYPDRGTQAGPDCATIRAEGQAVRVSVGRIFKRDPAKRSHPLELDAPGG